MVGRLVRALRDCAVDYCIPQKDIAAASAHQHRTGSTRKTAALTHEASALFSDLKRSGEGGELLLFVITEAVLNYPQAVAKMALKTNSRMHIHGADGIYVSVQPGSTRLRLHFGESKVYADGTAAVRECVQSIAPMLNDEGFLEEGSRDAFIFNTRLDLGDETLERAVLGFLDIEDPMFMSPQVCGILLVGHNLADYPAIINGEELPNAVEEEALRMLKLLEKHADTQGISQVHLDIIVVPFPDVEEFRKILLRQLNVDVRS